MAYVIFLPLGFNSFEIVNLFLFLGGNYSKKITRSSTRLMRRSIRSFNISPLGTHRWPSSVPGGLGIFNWAWLGWRFRTIRVKSFQQNTSVISLYTEEFKVNNLRSRANGSEEKVYKFWDLKLGQCVGGHVRWFCFSQQVKEKQTPICL